MKNLAVKSLLVLSVIVMTGFTMKETSFLGVKKILGEWDYTVPEASYEYQNGVLVLSKVDGDLSGEVQIGGQGIPLEELVYAKNNLKATIYVQGESVKLDLNFKKKSFEGTVSYSQGTMNMKGTKK